MNPRNCSLSLPGLRSGNPLRAGLSRVLVMAGVLASTLSLRASDEGWLTDFEAAKKKAAEEKKDLLVDFTGSDWCHWCIRLHEEVFSQETFQKFADSKFVLLEIDFPRGKELDEKLQAQNESLSERFGVQGFPTVFLLDSKGRPYAQTGYQPGGTEKYLPHLTTLQAARIQRDEHFEKAEKAEGVERAKHLDAALTVLTKQEPPVSLLPEYSKEVEQIIALDPDNEAGLKTAYEKRVRDFELRGELAKIERALMTGEDKDKETALASAEGLLKKVEGKGEIAQRIYLIQAQLTFQEHQADPAKGIPLVIALLEKAKEAAPETEFGAQVPGLIERLRGELKKVSESSEESEESDESESEE